jgi:hypothetical protein
MKFKSLLALSAVVLLGFAAVSHTQALPVSTTDMHSDMVTKTSANPGWATSVENVKVNHTTIKTGNNVRKLVEQTISLGRE